MRLLVAAGLLAARAAVAQAPAADQYLIRQSLPAWGLAVLDAPAFAGKYAIESRLNPFFQQADLDGDGKLDLAVLIVEKSSGKHGVALLRRVATTPVVIGAGRDFGNGGDDWSWMDVWRVDEAPAPPGKPRYHLVVEKSESGGGRIVWDGRIFRWKQAGD